MNLIIMGAIGSGKGTQARFISEKYQLAYISTGDIMRRHIKDETPIGKKIKDILASGGYVDDELTTELLKDRLTQEDCKQGFILDGYPRTMNQAHIITSIADIDSVLYLKVDNETVIKRLGGRLTCRDCSEMFHVESKPPKVAGTCDKCGGELYKRDDETEEAIANRLAIFERETVPTIEFFQGKGMVTTIEGVGDIAAITAEIFKELDKL